MTLAARIFIARVQATSRKAARKRRSDLERELAGYATSAERGDLKRLLTGTRTAPRTSYVTSSPVNPWQMRSGFVTGQAPKAGATEPTEAPVWRSAASSPAQRSGRTARATDTPKSRRHDSRCTVSRPVHDPVHDSL